MRTLDLLQAEHIGSRELKINTAKYINKKTPSIVTLNGKPGGVLVPYETMVEILKDLEESKN